MNAIEASETDKDAMERLMEYTEAKCGDVFLVPAKTVHAIGEGCLILEVQEPTDFTIQPERWCDEYRLSDDEMYIGLSKEDAVDCFNFEKAPDTRLEPQIVSEDGGVKLEKLIAKEHTDCFIINRITLSGGSAVLNIDGSYGVYIVTDGSGVIEGESYYREIKKGDYFFMPFAAMNKYTVSGDAEIIECY